MFHLFSKVYLDFDYNLEPGNRIIISEAFAQMTFQDEGLGYIGYLAPSYDALIADFFANDEENLWSFLTTLPDTKMVIYCDIASFNTMLVKYWRALLPNTTLTDLYMLYCLTIQKFKLMHSQIAHAGAFSREAAQKLEVMSQSDFTTLAGGLTELVPFQMSVKERISMEYLVAAKLSSTPSDLEAEFNARAEKIIWKSVAWEINEFKRNILNGFYDLDTLYPELSGVMNYGRTTLDEVIAVVPELSFLGDMDCHPDNIDYIRDNYDISAIFNAYFKLIVNNHGDAEAIDGFLRAHASYAGTLASVLPYEDEFTVSEDDIDAMLDLDINLRFGTSLFARTEYRKKMNAHIISYFYHLKRTGDMETLDRFAAA